MQKRWLPPGKSTQVSQYILDEAIAQGADKKILALEDFRLENVVKIGGRSFSWLSFFCFKGGWMYSIPWRIHGTGTVYLPTWMVDCYGKLMGKYTFRPMVWVYVETKTTTFQKSDSPWCQAESKSSFECQCCVTLIDKNLSKGMVFVLFFFVIYNLLWTSPAPFQAHFLGA